MKLFFKAALCVVVFIISLNVMATAQAIDVERWLVLAKDAKGIITRTSLELTMAARADCDQTQRLIPEGSRLTSEKLLFDTDSSGVGTFQGYTQLIAPDGHVVAQGMLRGTIGINTGCRQNGECRTPGHLEGWFESSPSTVARAIERNSSSYNAQMLVLHFSADPIAEAASPVPFFRAKLDGMVPAPLPVVERVKIVPDKSGYTAFDTITAIISNGSDKLIQAMDQESYCTIVQLQIQNEDGKWVEVAPCSLDRATQPTFLSPGQSLKVPLGPSPTAVGHRPGVYRLALTFRVVDVSTSASERLTVTSAPFRVIDPTPTPERVRVSQEKEFYKVGETIVAKISNGNDQTIYTYDHKSYCSVVNLQRQDGNNWVNIAPCPLASVPQLMKVAAQDGLLLKLPTESRPLLKEGVYRLEFVYFFDNATQRLATYSPLFKVIEN